VPFGRGIALEALMSDWEGIKGGMMLRNEGWKEGKASAM